MFREDEDWREYAKAGKFADTPDDLLKELPGPNENRVSELLLEHAARRVRLIEKTGVKFSNSQLIHQSRFIAATMHNLSI